MFDKYRGTNNAKCPLCDRDASAFQEGIRDVELISCPSCGAFKITGPALIGLPRVGSAEAKNMYLVSSELRRASEISSQEKDLIVLTTSELDALIARVNDPGVAAKLNFLLLELGKKSAYPGALVQFDLQNDYTLFFARENIEAIFYLQSLHESHLIQMKSADSVMLTAEGWSRLDELSKVQAASNNAFIAMWFSPDMKPSDDAISSAILATGYTPLRIDRIEHVNRIDDEIIAQIRKSKFLVADLTGHRNGVYFEAGFMLGLGRPVIWCCRKDQLPEAHFDTRQYNMIDYSSEDELQQRLAFRIEALLGRGEAAIDH